MMDKILYKSYPSLFVLTTSFGGFALMGLLSRLCCLGIHHNDSNALYFFPIFFGLISIWALFLFLKIRVIRLKAATIEFSYLLVPIWKKFPLEQVRNISQRKKRLSVQQQFMSAIQINYRVTSFVFADDFKMEINSLGAIDFEELMRCYNKLTRGNGEVRTTRRKFAQYLMNNLEDMWIAILFFIITIGLGVAMSKGA